MRLQTITSRRIRLDGIPRGIEVQPEEIEEILSDWNANYLLTSAKSGENVTEGFLTVSRDIIKAKFDLA